MAKEPDKRDDKHDTKAEHKADAPKSPLTHGDLRPVERGVPPRGGAREAYEGEGEPATPTARPNILSPTSDQLQAVVDTHVTIFSPDELSVLNAAVVELKDYEAITAPKLPVVRDVPHVQQVGDHLTCTMGNWEHEPTSYGYEWFKGDVSLGPGAPEQALLAEDVGASFTCVVTATNDAGSTVAPPSNPVVVTDPAARART